MLSWVSPTATAARGDRDAALFAGKVLLVVGTGGPKRGPVFDRLRSLGLARVTCLNGTRNWAGPYVDDWLLADPVDPDGDAVPTVLAAFGQPGSPRLDGVLTFDEFSVEVAAAIAERLGLVGPGREVAHRVRDKLAFRAFCRTHGLPTPRHLRVDGTADDVLARVAAEGLRFPLILKPARGGGSAFVRKVTGAAELATAIAAYRADLPTVAASWGDGGALVEEYLEGPEVDIDMLVQGGEVRYCEVTDNFITREPYFLETGGCFPSRLPAATQEDLRAMATGVVTALGIRDGCIHFEAKATPDGPMPIEVNLRLGGAEVFAFHRAARGIDLATEAVKIALGAPVAAPVADRPRRFLASTNFVPERAGVLKAIDIDPGVWRSPDLVEIVLFADTGTSIALPPAAYQYLGWLVAAGDDPEDAREHVNALARRIAFDIGPGA